MVNIIGGVFIRKAMSMLRLRLLTGAEQRNNKN
jgi:hypothetical protein